MAYPKSGTKAWRDAQLRRAEKERAAALEPADPGSRDSAAVRDAAGLEVGTTMATGAAVPLELVSPEEAARAQLMVIAVFKLVALVLGPEWEMTESYARTMGVGMPAALTLRKRFPAGAEPETQLATAVGPHVLGATTTTINRVQAKRAQQERELRGEPSAGNGARGPRRERTDPRAQGLGED